MRPKAILLAAVFALAAAVTATAEVALDEVVQAGRFALYRDHADAHKYYYVPDAPRLATKRDGTPEFTFIKYSKTDGATKGGIIHFLVTWGFSEGELASAESALRLKDPQAKIAGPVPFKEGTFKVVSATAGEGGLFNRKIVGEGKAPIMPGQKAAVSIALTEEGASLLWESFKNPTSDISVLFDLKFAGVTPAFQAKLKVNWDKVYTQHDIKLHAEGTIKVVKLQADVRAILESLRQQGAIQLDVVGENENMQKMLDAVYGHLITLMCDKVPMGPGEATSPPAKKRPVPVPEGIGPDVHPVWSMSAVAGVVRAADERLRGGPFVDQDQVQTQQAASQAPPCDPAALARHTLLFAEGLRLIRADNYMNAAQKYKEAYAACPVPADLYWTAFCLDKVQEFSDARSYYVKFLQAAAGDDLPEERGKAQARLAILNMALPMMEAGGRFFNQQEFEKAVGQYQAAFELTGSLVALHNSAAAYQSWGWSSQDPSHFEQAVERFSRVASEINDNPAFVLHHALDELRWSSLRSLKAAQEDLDKLRAAAPPVKPEGQAAAQTERAQTEQATAEERRARRQQTQVQAADQTARGQAQAQEQAQAAQQATSGGAQAGAAGASGQTTAQTGGGKPPTGATQAANVAAGQGAQQTTSTGQSGKPPDTTGGTKPPTGASGQNATTPAAKPAAAAPEIKPIVSVQVGYSFKRIKMSGNYEVDMRKRLREDRDIVMSGNIGGIYQKYGEDRRFFSVVSLDDPTFQERAVEVILDGQDAADFKSYINAVSVLFRKQRFSGPPMTGEVKFVDQQFAQSGNRQSFKYGRLNEASTEWLDYEYKPKWSLYGGVEWEGEWAKTSDSVLTLTPPVRRRTIEISVDEDNILKNGVKALAVQVKHTLYGKDILKEVVVNYDKGDPLQTDYTYMHEDGNLGYSYKVVWLFLDGREIHTDWAAKESPFIYAVFTKK